MLFDFLLLVSLGYSLVSSKPSFVYIWLISVVDRNIVESNQTLTRSCFFLDLVSFHLTPTLTATQGRGCTGVMNSVDIF